MKKFFHAIGLWFVKAFGGLKKFTKFLEEHVDDAIAIGNRIRAYVDSPILVGIIDLLPEKYRNASQDVIKKIEAALIKAIDDMSIAEACLQKTTTQEKLLCFIEALKKKKEYDRDGALVKTMSRFIVHNSGGEIKSNIADTLLQTRFLDLKHGITG